MTNQELVLKFLNGFNKGSNIESSLDLLADNYTFQNPMVSVGSKQAFTELALAINEIITSIKVTNCLAADNWVAVNYIFTSNIPGVEHNNATEWFRLKNGKIQESQLIYDATEWQKVYAI